MGVKSKDLENLKNRGINFDFNGTSQFYLFTVFYSPGRLTEDSGPLASSSSFALPPTPSPTRHFEPSITEFGLHFQIYYFT